MGIKKIVILKLRKSNGIDTPANMSSKSGLTSGISGEVDGSQIWQKKPKVGNVLRGTERTYWGSFCQVLLAAQYSLLQDGNNRRASWIELKEPVQTEDRTAFERNHFPDLSFQRSWQKPD